jgi:opine dehydrogenase
MASNPKQAVIGAGGGGQVMAAHLLMNGASVNLYEHPDFQHVIEPIIEQGGIYLTGVLGRYFAQLDLVTTDMGEALHDAEIVHIVIPAFAQEKIFELLVPNLRDGTVIILHPGYLGSILLSKMIDQSSSLGNCVVAEAQTMLYNSRNKDLGHAWAFGIKKYVQLSAFPAKNTEIALKSINSALPYYVASMDVLEAFLNNIAIVFHPAPSVLNTGLIESTNGNFRYYWDGVTDSVARVTEGVDQERLNVMRELGYQPISSKEWLINFYEHYGAKGKNLREVMLNCSNYEKGATPSNMKFTYVSQDVPYGIMLMIKLAAQLGVKVPISETIANLACYINDTNYWDEARTIEDLGLANLTSTEMKKYLQSGSA